MGVRGHHQRCVAASNTARILPNMSAAGREVVEVQHQHAIAPRQVRISRKVRAAIDLMVHKAQKRDIAAKTVGLTDDAMRKAMHKPDVLAYMHAQQQALRTSAAARSIARVDILADESTSDHVKLESNKFLLGIEGISVVQKSENLNVHKHFIPGLTLNIFNGAAPGDDAHLIDGQAREVRSSPPINGLPTPVPHPSMRNAVQIAPETDGQPAKTKARRRAPGGEKP